MSLKELKCIGRELGVFLAMFASCFASLVGRRLLKVYVQGQLSDIKNKNCEAIALKFDQTPRTLQRFVESIKWNEEQVRDRCQQIVARDHAPPEAIGTVDESGIAKSGSCTAALRSNGSRPKNSTTGPTASAHWASLTGTGGSTISGENELSSHAAQRHSAYIARRSPDIN